MIYGRYVSGCLLRVIIAGIASKHLRSSHCSWLQLNLIHANMCTWLFIAQSFNAVWFYCKFDWLFIRFRWRTRIVALFVVINSLVYLKFRFVRSMVKSLQIKKVPVLILLMNSLWFYRKVNSCLCQNFDVSLIFVSTEFILRWREYIGLVLI